MNNMQIRGRKLDNYAIKMELEDYKNEQNKEKNNGRK